MITNPNEEKYILTKKGLFLRLQNKVGKSKKCCDNWKDCVFYSECLLSQILWSPIRSEFSQNNFELGRLVTTDCFFSPPNILDIGLVIDIKPNIILIYYWQGQVVALGRENLFVFPPTELLTSFDFALKEQFRNSNYFNPHKNSSKFFN